MKLPKLQVTLELHDKMGLDLPFLNDTKVSGLVFLLYGIFYDMPKTAHPNLVHDSGLGVSHSEAKR